MKKQEGITLIALVITIIIMLILAGISVASITGPNGLLTRALNARSEDEKAKVVEAINYELTALHSKNLEGKDIKDEDIVFANEALKDRAEAVPEKDANGKIIRVTITGKDFDTSGTVEVLNKIITLAK